MRNLIMVTTFLFGFVSTALGDMAQIDMKALTDAGAATARKLSVSPAKWDVRHTLGSGAVIHVSVLRAGDRQRTIFTLERGGHQAELFRIVSRDGFWYVTDRTGSSKYRPYEAPADSPFIYMTLERSAPLFVDTPKQLLAGKLEGIEGTIATFRTPLEENLSKQLQGTVDQMESMSRESKNPLPAEIRDQMREMKKFIADGVATCVDLSTGQLIEFGAPKVRTRVNELKFLSQVDDHEFAVDNQNWIDCSADPTAGNLDDLLMIGHQPGVHVGDKNYDLDGRLMDVKTGRFRRIPFPGGLSMPSCFLKDRRYIVVSGIEGDTGAVRPFQIDLKTRQCIALGGPMLDHGFSLFGDVSPDGKNVVVVHIDPAAGAGLLKSQICVIDLATRFARPLGQPMDTAFVSWTADGLHLVLLARKYKDLNAKTINSLAIMDMDGHVTELRHGNFPVLLADRQTILYQEDETGLWHTCDLKGNNDRLYGDGLAGYGFPAVAPDGKRILFMHFTPNSLPDPVVLPIGESQGQVIRNDGGLWGTPAWR
jgi:hypothetical protein